jgi:hypothetical protein
MRASAWLACAAVAWTSWAAGAGDTAPDAAWGRMEHERLADTMLRHAGAVPRRDCPVEPAFVDHFGTPLCGYVELGFDELVDLLVARLAALPGVEVRRVHASPVEAYLELLVHGRQHLVDVALAPNARGERLVLWFVPDLPPRNDLPQMPAAGPTARSRGGPIVRDRPRSRAPVVDEPPY